MSHSDCCIDTSVPLISSLCHLALQVGLQAATKAPGAAMPVVESVASVAEIMNRVAEQVFVAEGLLDDVTTQVPLPELEVDDWLQGV